MAKPAVIEFSGYAESVPQALDAIGAAALLAAQDRVLINPNLVGMLMPPITTPVACVSAIIDYVKQHYQRDRSWKKSFFHIQTHLALLEMNSYRTADLVLLDATVGMAEYHLGGAQCDPPVNKIVAGTDPVAVDKISAELLGLDWREIPHLAEAGNYQFPQLRSHTQT